ncbi:hypothetical protein [Methylobacterium sp. J-092]|uniref:hypothetical protein n=1 Tax=Methylobacterium sp. J-092 TaxID=2836667 RepID=UPI001FBA232C|nr:hypothetical protein [Methylobacterium sp. J-092]MCJ2009174.1 hypothetical protein [Methylobacterium sp. J-092]
MPIRPEHRFFYPIHWRQLSHQIRFDRADGRCERCRRPHGATIVHLGDGRWYDSDAGAWRDGNGRRLRGDTLIGDARPGITRVFLATAHREHDTSRNGDRDLAAWCQRCHMLHDAPEHARRRRLTFLRGKTLGDLFSGPYPLS